MTLKKPMHRDSCAEINTSKNNCSESYLPAQADAPHTHAHKHTQTHAVLNRMARIIGHMTAVRRMVESERDCSDVLIQLSAINAAVTNVSKLMLKDHLEHCIVDAAKTNDTETIEKLKSAIDKFIK